MTTYELKCVPINCAQTGMSGNAVNGLKLDVILT